METSCFKRYTGDRGVAICLFPPKGYLGESFPALAPDKETFFLKKSNEISEEEYEIRYRKNTLSKLDPNVIFNLFRDKVILCWEDPGEFCHRRIVANWISENTGYPVPEWENKKEGNTNNNIKLF